jgi:hypothetical protein
VRHPEPAFLGQETVHIAGLTSEIRLILKAEHKGEIPETAGKIVFIGTKGKSTKGTSTKRKKLSSDLFCSTNITGCR